MTDTAKGLNKFFNGFGIPAYDEFDVPDTATLPYLTYQNVEPRWDESGSVTAMIYYPGTSYAPINAKIDEIKRAFPKDGCLRVPVDSGCLQIFIDRNFATEMVAESDTIRAYQLLFGIHAFCN